MTLFEWRKKHNLDFGQAARQIGLDGVNPGRTWARFERGERQPDADTVDRIVTASGGEITPNDLHDIRLAWLRANRAEKFSQDADHVPPAGPADVGPALSEAAE